MAGRLTINKFGPTKAADAIVIRGSKNDPEVLMVKRGDNGKWALPAGKLTNTKVRVMRPNAKHMKRLGSSSV